MKKIDVNKAINLKRCLPSVKDFYDVMLWAKKRDNETFYVNTLQTFQRIGGASPFVLKRVMLSRYYSLNSKNI